MRHFKQTAKPNAGMDATPATLAENLILTKPDIRGFKNAETGLLCLPLQPYRLFIKAG